MAAVTSFTESITQSLSQPSIVILKINQICMAINSRQASSYACATMNLGSIESTVAIGSKVSIPGTPGGPPLKQRSPNCSGLCFQTGSQVLSGHRWLALNRLCFHLFVCSKEIHDQLVFEGWQGVGIVLHLRITSFFHWHSHNPVSGPGNVNYFSTELMRKQFIIISHE